VDGAPVPTCSDGQSMCVWSAADYESHGTRQFPQFPGVEPFKWDGSFERGYGRSRCIALPKSCGQPGEPCCPSMTDQRISGLVHNRLFPYQVGRILACLDLICCDLSRRLPVENHGLIAPRLCLLAVPFEGSGFAEPRSNGVARAAGWRRPALPAGLENPPKGWSRAQPQPPLNRHPPTCEGPTSRPRRTPPLPPPPDLAPQPCNYRAAGKVGMYCNGAWQGTLLKGEQQLGTCTLNAEDCGKVGGGAPGAVGGEGGQYLGWGEGCGKVGGPPVLWGGEGQGAGEWCWAGRGAGRGRAVLRGRGGSGQGGEGVRAGRAALGRRPCVGARSASASRIGHAGAGVPLDG
jgi:hypothetical protein